MYKMKSYEDPLLMGPETYKHYKRVSADNAWVILGCKVAKGVAEAAWVVLGGCPNYLAGLRFCGVIYWTDREVDDHSRDLRDNGQD